MKGWHSYFAAPNEGATLGEFAWVHNAKYHATYTKTRASDGKVYSGRVSGNAAPAKLVSKRDVSHHMNKEGYGPAKLDKYSTRKSPIRGREEQLIEKHGGAQSSGGKSGNAIHGISERNKKKARYLRDARKEFGDS